MLNLTYNITDTTLDINFHKVNRPILSWKEEVKNTATYIKDSTDKEIIVATSGGIDAEVACRGFLDAGIPFRMFIVEFDNGSNAHDVFYAHKFASTYNIEKIVHNVDMEKFLEKGMYRYVVKGYKAVNPYRYFQIYLLEQIQKLGCCGVVGSGDIALLSKGNNICLSYEQEYFLAVDWCKNNGLLHYPAFHLATPEITTAFLNHPVTKFMTSDYKHLQRKGEWMHFNPEKIILYHTEYTDMIRRKKFIGFEGMMDQFNSARDKLKSYFPSLLSTDIPLEQVLNQLANK